MQDCRTWLNRQLVLGVLSLCVTILVFEWTNLDMVVQHVFYLESRHAWILSHDNKIARWIFYDGIKILLILFSLVLFGLIVLSKFRAWRGRLNSGPLLLVLLSMVTVPLLVAELKQTTNMACPKHVVQFGGDVHRISLLRHYSEFDSPDKQQKCFPAAHASGGFSLMSLMFLFATRRKRRIALVAGISMGWIMGLYKMAIGDHFLSHTLVSMILAWLVICAIARVLLASGQLTPSLMAATGYNTEKYQLPKSARALE